MLIWLSRISVTVTVLLITYYSTKYAVADFYFERSQANYSALNLDALESSHQLFGVLDDINNALVLRPNSAKVIDFKADVLYQSWWISPDGQYLQDSTLLQTVVALHIKANKFRQGWAFNASRLAITYSHQRELKQNFDHWFSKSYQLGLYETQVARSMMFLGLENWNKLSATQKTMTLDFIRASIEQKSNSIKSILSVLEQYQQLEQICSPSKKTDRMKLLCNKVI